MSLVIMGCESGDTKYLLLVNDVTISDDTLFTLDLATGKVISRAHYHQVDIDLFNAKLYWFNNRQEAIDYLTNNCEPRRMQLLKVQKIYHPEIEPINYPKYKVKLVD